MLSLAVGGPQLVESMGLGEIDLVVVETNGEIDGVDSLKAAYDGAAKLGFNVQENSFDDVLKHSAVRLRQSGAAQLNAVCQECPVNHICGGGYIPHRFSKARGFDNPTVYCDDIKTVVHGVLKHVVEELQSATASGPS